MQGNFMHDHFVCIFTDRIEVWIIKSKNNCTLVSVQYTYKKYLISSNVCVSVGYQISTNFNFAKHFPSIVNGREKTCDISRF